ncbi:uncharacterized protein [Halyomorpha halys]|uniref:uncharacterized protein n=1 Tax=Halyomorpha halys TaxID=286706 RepID=UPI0034D2EF59
MKDLNVPVKLIRLVNLTMSNTECMVQVQGDLSEGFTFQNGVLQGDSLDCLLFNIGLEKVIRELKVQTSGTIGYADDIDIIGRSKAVVEEAFLVLDHVARKLELVVITDKTGYMIPGQERDFNEDFEGSPNVRENDTQTHLRPSKGWFSMEKTYG